MCCAHFWRLLYRRFDCFCYAAAAVTSPLAAADASTITSSSRKAGVHQVKAETIDDAENFRLAILATCSICGPPSTIVPQTRVCWYAEPTLDAPPTRKRPPIST